MITGGQAAVRSLVAHGVTDLFGVPGLQLDPFYNAIFDEGRPFSVYTARHEQGAAYMALGYAATSGRLGVLAVVPGPGLLNASAGIATAWSMSAPMLTLAGQISSEAIDRGGGLLHEIANQPSTVSSFTRSQRRAAEADDISPLIARTIADIQTGDPRPALVELPPDVLAASCADVVAAPIEPVQPQAPHAELLAAADLMHQAEHPMIVVGGGAQTASDEVTRLAELLGAPVVAHRRGRGVVDERHPLSVSYGVGRDLWPSTDVVIAIGTRLQMQLSEWGVDDSLRQIWINPDSSASALGTAAVDIAARAEDVLPPLIAELVTREHAPQDRTEVIAAAAAEEDRSIEGLEPQLAYLEAIRAALPDDGILVSDLTQLGYVSRLRFEVRRPRSYLYPAYMGTLGWALPVALGAKIANPNSPVVAVMGDGGFGFTGMELATAVRYDIPVVTIIFDNRAYGNVKLLQRDNYEGRVHATDLASPDFAALATAFGARAARADDPGSLGHELTAALENDGPSVIWVPHGDWPNPWPVLANRRVRG